MCLPVAHNNLGLLPHLVGHVQLRRRRSVDPNRQRLARVRPEQRHTPAHFHQRRGLRVGLDEKDIVHSGLAEADGRELEAGRQRLDDGLVDVLFRILGRVFEGHLAPA